MSKVLINDEMVFLWDCIDEILKGAHGHQIPLLICESASGVDPSCLLKLGQALSIRASAWHKKQNGQSHRKGYTAPSSSLKIFPSVNCDGKFVMFSSTVHKVVTTELGTWHGGYANLGSWRGSTVTSHQRHGVSNHRQLHFYCLFWLTTKKTPKPQMTKFL